MLCFIAELELFKTEKVSVRPNSVESVTFLITPNKMGNIELNVKGTSRQAGDALVKILKVVPPGQTQRVSKGVLLDLRSRRPYTTNVTMTFPPKRVPESDVIKVSVIGDVLGPAISNLDKLLGESTAVIVNSTCNLHHGCAHETHTKKDSIHGTVSFIAENLFPS